MDVFVSVHIPKTAGTNFRAQLRALPFDAVYVVYPGGHPEAGLWLRNNGDLGRERGEWDERVRRCLSSKEELVRSLCVHGHIMAREYLEAVPQNRFITWLRDPVERVASHYYFWKRVEVPGDPNWREFIRSDWSLIEFARQSEYKNVQSRYLAGLDIKRMGFVGLVERYDDGIRRLEQLFKVSIPRALQKANANPQRRGSTYTIDSDVRREIWEINAEDVLLYDSAKSLWG